ncbi:MAG: TIGR04084 family radical SAM/SPASM domain-containing protein [Candidatus Methanomethylicia archaeon]
MLYILHTTGQCNLNCKYCGGSFPQRLVPWRIEYKIEDLQRFIEGDPNPIIAFYGGEPLLNSKFIMKVMDEIPNAKYVIQTNATLIENLKYEYWLKFDAILLSIDGRREITDYYRGKGVYDKVIEAGRKLREIGYKKDLIARMTVTEKSKIYVEVKHLISIGIFDHIHWQLNVIWSRKWRNFRDWSENYLYGVKMLIKEWLKNAEEGRIIGIAPILGILKTALQDLKIESPPCGSGRTSISISSNGKIYACPIAVDSKWAEIGDLWNNNWKNVKRISIGEPCIKCEYYNYCGGRCLYAYMEKLWGERGFKEICNITKKTIREVLKIKDEVLKLADSGKISLYNMIYPKFSNTIEIIP